MTGYTVNTGSTEQFASGWDRVFGGTKRTAKQAGSAARKVVGKAAGKSKSIKNKARRKST